MFNLSLELFLGLGTVLVSVAIVAAVIIVHQERHKRAAHSKTQHPITNVIKPEAEPIGPMRSLGRMNSNPLYDTFESLASLSPRLRV